MKCVIRLGLAHWVRKHRHEAAIKLFENMYSHIGEAAAQEGLATEEDFESSPIQFVHEVPKLPLPSVCYLVLHQNLAVNLVKIRRFQEAVQHSSRALVFGKPLADSHRWNRESVRTNVVASKVCVAPSFVCHYFPWIGAGQTIASHTQFPVS